MAKTSCKVKGCGARAWQSSLCNLHALERHKTTTVRRKKISNERLAEGKRLLRQRARELGIVLAEDESKKVTVRAMAKDTTQSKTNKLVRVGAKVASPVG